MERRKLNVRLPLDLFESLGSVAGDYDLSMNAVVVMAVRNYVGLAENTDRLPSPRSGRRAESSKKETAAIKPTYARNAPCHCGSGKKYKRCCYLD